MLVYNFCEARARIAHPFVGEALRSDLFCKIGGGWHTLITLCFNYSDFLTKINMRRRILKIARMEFCPRRAERGSDWAGGQNERRSREH